MSKFLITGGTGFVGANLVRALLARGDEVHLLVRENASFWRLADVKEKCTLHVADLTGGAAVTALFETVRPDTVFHLAVQGSNPGEAQVADQVFSVNVEGTKNIANACAKVGCVLVNTGSSSEYGLKDAPMKENDVLKPANLYGNTKATGTTTVQYFATAEKLPMVTLRLFSPFGYFDHSHRLIPALILNTLHKTSPTLYSPDARRDFVFIEDVVAAYLHFAEKARDMPGEIVNIGSGRSHSVAETVSAIENIIGVSLGATYGAHAKQTEPKEWVADITKAESLGWKPATSFEDGLRKTIDWFRMNEPLYL